MTATPEHYTVTVDDDPLVARMVAAAMGMPSRSLASGAAFREAAPTLAPVAIFIDVHLGLDDSGLDLIPFMRERWQYTPLIVVTSESSGEAVGQALAAGANDFIKKPIDAKELTARFRARASECALLAVKERLNFGDLTLDLARNELGGPDGKAYLSHSDMKLLAYLTQANGTLISREELKRKLWGSLKVSDNALDKKLYEVRQAFKATGAHVRLQSSYGKGFSLVADADKTDKLEKKAKAS